MDAHTIAKTQLGDMALLLRPATLLDNYSAPEMIEILKEALRGNVRYVIVDMEQVEFISSAGVGALIGNVEAFRARGGDLIICSASPTVLHVFAVLDLTDYVTIRPSVKEAQALLQPVQ